VKFTSPGRIAPPRDIRVWFSSAAYAVLTGAVLVALVALHTWSDRKEAAAQAVSTLRTSIIVEQEARLDPLDGRTMLQANTNAALVLVESSDVSNLTRITGLTNAYQAAISMELTALRAGDTQAAATINTAFGDSRFTTLDAELASETHADAASASSGVAIAFAASIGMVIGAGLLISLFALVARRRRGKIVAIEAIAARFAHEAGLAATREETFRSLFDENPQPMLVTRLPALTSESGNLQFLSVNNAALDMYGYSRAEFLALNLSEIRPPEDRAQLLSILHAHAVRGGCTHFEGIRHCTKAGHVLDIEVDIRQTIFNGESAMIICPNDVTDRVRLRRELEHQAFHDVLTGLPNRSLFGDRLEHAHQRLERSGECYAVLVLDLDNFKTVNDSLGHAAGDDLLVRVSERLVAVIRSGDTAARLGGDEFAILLEDLSDPADAVLAAENLRAALRMPFLIAGRTLTVTATLGVSTSSGEGAAADIMRNADVALYEGKAEGKDRSAVFTETMYVAAVERMTLEQDLRVGIGRGELMLLYQPKVDAQTMTMQGVEALVRWNHPLRGVIAPDVFIPIAEQSGLINELDTWVLATACRQAQEWATSGIAPVPVAVNVSGRSLVSCGLVERVLDALRQTGLDPRLLELEITESAAVPQHGEALELLQTIRDLGVRIAIDDFGTGYSVLSRLQGFPVDTLKIDLSFTRAICSEVREAPIVDAMIAMGLSLGLKIVAEGVETEVQRRYLAKRRCSELQGYLISRPIGPAELVAQFSTPKSTPAARSKAAAKP